MQGRQVSYAHIEVHGWKAFSIFCLLILAFFASFGEFFLSVDWYVRIYYLCFSAIVLIVFLLLFCPCYREEEDQELPA
jgi:membrane protein YdbS with pleckstrin-like domain